MNQFFIYIRNLFVQASSHIERRPQNVQAGDLPKCQTNPVAESGKNNLESWKFKRLLSDNGLFYVSNDIQKNGLWGVADTAGNILVPPRWKRAFPHYSSYPDKPNVIWGLFNNEWEEFNGSEKQ